MLRQSFGTGQEAAVRIGVVGAGSWGTSLIRNVADCPSAILAAVCDPSEAARAKVARRYPTVALHARLEELLADASVDAVIVATPPVLHYRHARAVLDAGRHVLVEKPMCTTAADAAELCRLAETQGLVLMCGHTVLFSNVLHDVRDRIRRGDLGEVRYLYCRRLNLGRVRPDVDVLWNLAPHDIAIMCFLLDDWPVSVNARGWSYVQPERAIADVCFFQMEYPGGVAVGGQVSWLDPQKDRSFVVVGTERMLVYNDLDPSRMVQIYDSGVECDFQSPLEGYADYSTRVRAGDLVIPHVRPSEPLAEEIRHFVECIETGTVPLSHGRQGYRLVSVLEAMSTSMNSAGRAVDVSYESLSTSMPPRTLRRRDLVTEESNACQPSPSTI